MSFTEEHLLKQGRALKVELQLLNIMLLSQLLMRKARLPTWPSIMQKVCKGLMEGTKYAMLFLHREHGDQWWQWFVQHHKQAACKNNHCS